MRKITLATPSLTKNPSLPEQVLGLIAAELNGESDEDKTGAICALIDTHPKELQGREDIFKGMKRLWQTAEKPKPKEQALLGMLSCMRPMSPGTVIAKLKDEKELTARGFLKALVRDSEAGTLVRVKAFEQLPWDRKSGKASIWGDKLYEKGDSIKGPPYGATFTDEYATKNLFAEIFPEKKKKSNDDLQRRAFDCFGDAVERDLILKRPGWLKSEHKNPVLDLLKYPLLHANDPEMSKRALSLSYHHIKNCVPVRLSGDTDRDKKMKSEPWAPVEKQYEYLKELAHIAKEKFPEEAAYIEKETWMMGLEESLHSQAHAAQAIMDKNLSQRLYEETARVMIENAEMLLTVNSGIEKQRAEFAKTPVPKLFMGA